MSFKYTGPGYYVTRDGRKALVGECIKPPIDVYQYTLCGIVYGGKTWGFQENRWTYDGNRLIAKVKQPDDLVGPWVDPPKPLECWVNVWPNGYHNSYKSKESAINDGVGYAVRLAVHMREVTE